MCEDLLVGDDSGKIYYYSLEWPEFAPGSMTLLAKIDAHSQNICGLAWSPDGMQFVSGGNDNRAQLFDPSIFLHADYQRHVSTTVLDHAADMFDDPGFRTPPQLPTPPASPQRYRSASHRDSSSFNRGPANSVRNFGLETPPPTPLRRGRVADGSLTIGPLSSPGIPRTAPLPNASVLRNALVDPGIPGQANIHVHSFFHAAAVKAIAFAPWQPNLLATGGGSNDRQIHFFHTGSGATLALINVFSQVTSLV
ncbi:WD domain-containing protein [Cladophialophora immunda]|nr:WD domain-containing protein [Cladophialophora immunda]